MRCRILYMIRHVIQFSFRRSSHTALLLLRQTKSAKKFGRWIKFNSLCCIIRCSTLTQAPHFCRVPTFHRRKKTRLCYGEVTRDDDDIGLWPRLSTIRKLFSLCQWLDSACGVKMWRSICSKSAPFRRAFSSQYRPLDAVRNLNGVRLFNRTNAALCLEHRVPMLMPGVRPLSSVRWVFQLRWQENELVPHRIRREFSLGLQTSSAP